MPNLNKVMLMGRLTRDPEVRFTPQGTAVSELGLAVNHVWYDKNRDKHEKVTFVDVTAWDRQAETLAKYLTKGDPLYVEGRLELSSWETKDGEKRSKMRVRLEKFEFLSSGRDRAPSTGTKEAPSGYMPPDEPKAEVPF